MNIKTWSFPWTKNANFLCDVASRKNSDTDLYACYLQLCKRRIYNLVVIEAVDWGVVELFLWLERVADATQ